MENKSVIRNVTCGIPQGFILGPGVSDNLFHVPFADDTSVFLNGKYIFKKMFIVALDLKKNKIKIKINKIHIEQIKHITI